MWLDEEAKMGLILYVYISYEGQFTSSERLQIGEGQPGDGKGCSSPDLGES